LSIHLANLSNGLSEGTVFMQKVWLTFPGKKTEIVSGGSTLKISSRVASRPHQSRKRRAP